MLARPEIGTKEDILLFLASEPGEKSYPYRDSSRCVCAQYSQARTGDALNWLRVEGLLRAGTEIAALNRIAAKRPWTFGALYERCRKAWDANG